MEFILLHTPNDHSPSIDELRKIVLRSNPDLKDKPLFWKRKASVLKVRMRGGGGGGGASVLKVRRGGEGGEASVLKVWMGGGGRRPWSIAGPVSAQGEGGGE